jgi:hypothetical protein
LKTVAGTEKPTRDNGRVLLRQQKLNGARTRIARGLLTAKKVRPVAIIAPNGVIASFGQEIEDLEYSLEGIKNLPGS